MLYIPYTRVIYVFLYVYIYVLRYISFYYIFSVYSVYLYSYLLNISYLAVTKAVNAAVNANFPFTFFILPVFAAPFTAFTNRPRRLPPSFA